MASGRVKWTRKGPHEWDGDTAGWGRLRITAARQRNRSWRFYLMDVPFMGDPTVLGDYGSAKEAQDAGSAFVSRMDSSVRDLLDRK